MSTITFFPFSDEAVLPFRGSAGAAGVDLSAAYETTVPARGHVMVSTELGVELESGWYGWLTSRSGLAKKGIVVESGIIDSDYRGCIYVVLYNHTDKDFHIRRGNRCAQLIVQPHLVANVVIGKPEDASTTDRGTNGFGSTGLEGPGIGMGNWSIA